MIESGFWIFLVEGIVAGVLFIGLIWWVVGGTKKRDEERLRNASKIQEGGEIVDRKDDVNNKNQ
jgi:hypothetical protein